MRNPILLPPAGDDNSGFERFWVQRLLRGGLALSVLLMLAGLGVYVAGGTFSGSAVTPAQIFGGQTPLAECLLGAGILVLALTPVMRVLTLMLLWWRQRDWRFVGVAAVVLCTLTLAVVLGKGG